MIKTAIVILNWNGVKLFEEFLPSVVKFSNSDSSQIYIIDNGSTDNSIKYLSEKHPDIIVIQLDKNYGFAGGYNKGLEKIDAQYYILLNSDIEVTQGWIDPVINYMEENNEVAACMPKIKSYRNREYFEHAGAAGGFIDYYGYPFCRGRIFNIVEKDMGQYNEDCEIFWATGACMFIRSELFKKNGGFDENFFAHMEEIELCWRLKNLGYKIMYNSKSTVYHLGGATLSYVNPRKTYLNFRNSLFMLFKNLPPNKLYYVFFMRLILDGIAAIKFIFSFEFGNFWAVLKAHLNFYLKIAVMWPQRKKLKSKATNYSHKQIIMKSIVYQFFIKRKKEYKQIISL